MASVGIRQIDKQFGTVRVLEGVSLEVRDGEFMTLVGPSGCGKSTLLRVIAGLEHQSAGSITIGERSVDHLRPSNRDLAMVFQSYALYPHLNAFENMAVPLMMRWTRPHQRIPFIGPFMPGSRQVAARIRQEVIEVAKLLDIEELLHRKPGQLSGGQRQRVAVGRAMVRHPQAFLMDEPLSNLDAKLRVHMRTEIAQLHRRLGTTFIYVTHDQAEAMTMSDRIAVMMDGKLLQVAPPHEVYSNPSDIRVAEFIGSPKINVLPGRLEAGSVSIMERRLELSAEGDDGPVSVCVRPEAVELTPPQTGLRGTITFIEDLGPELFVHIALEQSDEVIVIAKLNADEHSSVAIDDRVGIDFSVNKALLFAKTGDRIRHHNKTGEPESSHA